jgi:YidC/Oxa1 family membrane protein insertase
MEQNPSGIFDRRTLLAFALMFAVFFGWATLSPLFAPEKPVEEEVTELAAPLETEAPAFSERTDPSVDAIPEPVVQETTEPMPSAGGWENEDPTGRGRPIRISTPRYDALLDPVGADLVEWNLREFALVDGTPVNLVHDRTTDFSNQFAHALAVQLQGHSLDLRNVVFEADRSEIVLDEGDEPEVLNLIAQRGETGQLWLQLTFDPGRYGFAVEAQFRGALGDEVPMRLEVGWPGGIAPTEPDSTNEYNEYRAVARLGEDVTKEKFSNLAKGGSKGHLTLDGMVSFGGVQSKYFLAAVINRDPQRGLVKLSGDNGIGVQTFRTDLGLQGTAPASVQYSVYLGPSDHSELKYYDEEPYQAQLTSLIDLGWGPIRPVAELTLFLLKQLYRVIPNWGWTIIVFSVLTKLLFWPLTRSSTESMKRMQEIQPELQSLKEKYKNDQQRQTQEMMRIYKENKVNPVGGCLPLLVQMPVFFALFTILRKTIDLRQADFALWINDLSLPDVLFPLGFELPFLGSDFSLLPLLMALAMWAQTRISQSVQPAGGGGGAENMMAQQMKMMNTMMPIMMFFIFYRSPSGLVLYWLVNTVLTAAQTWRVHNNPSKAAALAKAGGGTRAEKVESKS